MASHALQIHRPALRPKSAMWSNMIHQKCDTSDKLFFTDTQNRIWIKTGQLYISTGQLYCRRFQINLVMLWRSALKASTIRFDVFSSFPHHVATFSQAFRFFCWTSQSPISILVLYKRACFALESYEWLNPCSLIHSPRNSEATKGSIVPLRCIKFHQRAL